MFPLRDHNPTDKRPYVTYGLIVLNVLIFLSYADGLNDARRIVPLFQAFAFTPAAFTQGSNAMGLVTSMFLHGSWMHLAGNMLFLWIFGDNMEDQFGHFGFTLFYLACGIVATLGHYFADPLSPYPLVGASGAIAGVMGGYLLLFPRAKVDVLFIFIIFFRIISFPAWVMLGFWIGLQILSGLEPQTGTGVAHWAHVGGFAIGVLLTLPIWARKGGPAFWHRTLGAPPHPVAEYRWRRTDVPTVRRGQRIGTRVPIVRRKPK